MALQPEVAPTLKSLLYKYNGVKLAELLIWLKSRELRVFPKKCLFAFVIQ